MPMNSDQLSLFLAICDEGSFSAAARKLRTSQPQVSAQIKRLEDSLGILLFDRSHRRAELTPLGMRLRTKARAIVDALESAKVSLQDEAAGRSGSLRVGIEDEARSEVITKRLRKFARRHRGIRLEVAVRRRGVETGCIDDLDVEIVTCGSEGLPDNAVVLESREIGIALPRKHRLAGRERLAVGDLLGETILAGSSGLAVPVDEMIQNLGVGVGFDFDRSVDRTLDERLWLVSLDLGLTGCVAEDVRRCGYRLDWCPLEANGGKLRTLARIDPGSKAALGSAFVDSMATRVLEP